ncbi:MAG TPA: hypothetical protein VNP92_15810 [Actinophytocola sp.]|nr:hypothetical protein [Actinophytocola sp.]
MHLPTAARPVRVRRLLAVSTVAAVVVLAPVAGVHDPPGVAERPDNHPGHGVGVGRTGGAAQPAVVLVGNTVESVDGDDSASESSESSRAAAVPPGGKDGDNNGLDVLGRDCSDSDLAPHDGFQESPACVGTQMGEVAAEDELPSLLITAAPETVEVDESFRLEVSTRNLVRDRFLSAADGGYYLESSFLDDDGLQRGHFHTACRILSSTNEAPDSGRDPEFFLATQDNEGGAEPDTVTIEVPGIDTAGELQCTSWAGDGSHRTPMMTKANQTPAIDSVRITVTE